MIWKRRTGLMSLVLLVGCASSSPVDKAISELKPGMTEAQVRALLEPHSVDSGTVYWGGSGARRIYFQLSGSEQIWIEMGRGPQGRVAAIGGKEPKQPWTRHDGGSISVGEAATRR
ncbi:MAG: hypothetical protein JXR96_03415 [Deltaproteobacteria bacterium]|nr:hypothetical protein [Deltaproteobacteria bacterium]